MAEVVGATSRAGYASCHMPEERGFRVALVARGEERLEALCKRIPRSGSYPADALDTGSVQAAFARITSDWGTPVSVTQRVGSIVLKPAHLVT